VRRVILVLLALVCGGCSSSPSPSASPTPLVAQVGPTAISNALFQIRLQSALTSVSQAGGPTDNPAMRSQVRASVLRSLIIDTVIAQEAAAAGVAATSAEIQAQLTADTTAAGGLATLQSQLASLGGSMAQLNDEIISSLNEQKVEDVFAKQRALEIEQKLTAGTAFTSLATQYSDDSATAAKGGDLGAVVRTTIQGDDPAYSGPVLALTAGHHTDPPIRDAQGYDIVELESSTATALSLRHIIVNAPQPYTVIDRPQWFSEAIFETLAEDCTSNQIHVYISDVGDNVCAAASSSPSPAASPGAPSRASASP
jgi:PBP1b-binding outer membrane lipoprotein LpoB